MLVVQWIEHLVAVQAVGGSIPLEHTMFKYFKSYASHFFSLLIAGNKNYATWKEKNYKLFSVTIKDGKIARELEVECEKKGGFLTYGEYLLIDQFGKNGYHATHPNTHGTTQTHLYWPKALIRLCQTQNLKNVIEVGPGDGRLAVELMKCAKNQAFPLIWNGIEVNSFLCKKIREAIKKNNLQNYFGTLSETLNPTQIKSPALYIFSYSLDSMPPEIFINTSDSLSFANTLLGISVKKGVLEEIVLTSRQLKRKGATLQNGIYKNKTGIIFNLRDIKLHPMQRLYFSVHAFSLLREYVEKAKKGSVFIVIDEFRFFTTSLRVNHLFLPRDLHTHSRECEDVGKLYKESGKNLFYFTTYFHTFLHILQQLGFEGIKYDSDQKLSKTITNERFFGSPKVPLCYALITPPKTKEPQKTIKIHI